MPDRKSGDVETVDTENPWIVIPYFAGDQGRQGIERPLTGIFYLSPSIIIEGVNYTPIPGFYEPDKALSIRVEVNNLGIPSAQVTVQLYWSDPATGFSTPTLIGVDTFAVAGRSVLGPTSSNPIIWTPEHSKVPSHFCLLAKATCFPPEPAPVPSVPDPVDDRHWAQHNLMAVVMTTPMKASSVFWAVNPDHETAAFTVTAEPLSANGLEQLARRVRSEGVPISQEQVILAHADGRARKKTSRDGSLHMEIEPRSRLPLVVTIRGGDLQPHQFTAIQLVQTRAAGKRRGIVTGSLAIVLYPARGR